VHVFAQDNTKEYKKRVLDQTEVKLLSSYYAQDGENAAVTGGRGTEELTDVAPGITVSVPLNDDDVLTIDASVSAYTSASSSNINPFDGSQPADPFVASTGASSQDVWFGFSGNYSHSSDDRNTIISGNASFAVEYDYVSAGFGGSITKLFNEKNTEVQLKANVFIDTWNPIYPIEFREGFNINNYSYSGTTNYAPDFTKFENLGRNSYSIGTSFSQVLSKKIQTIFLADLILQDGLLSTPHQRVYFSDIPETLVENFSLGNDIERLPDSRFKMALANRSSFYINQNFILRSYYRFYSDDWGITSHTMEITLPIKLFGNALTLYPSYRFYNQTAADYFYAYKEALSTDAFYTSDYDLAKYSAHQYSMGFKYYDPYNKFSLGGFGLKSISLDVGQYSRTTQNFDAFFASIGFNFIATK
jgi:hypothetical protein